MPCNYPFVMDSYVQQIALLESQLREQKMAQEILQLKAELQEQKALLKEQQMAFEIACLKIKLRQQTNCHNKSDYCKVESMDPTIILPAHNEIAIRKKRSISLPPENSNITNNEDSPEQFNRTEQCIDSDTNSHTQNTSHKTKGDKQFVFPLNFSGFGKNRSPKHSPSRDPSSPNLTPNKIYRKSDTPPGRRVTSIPGSGSRKESASRISVIQSADSDRNERIERTNSSRKSPMNQRKSQGIESDLAGRLFEELSNSKGISVCSENALAGSESLKQHFKGLTRSKSSKSKSPKSKSPRLHNEISPKSTISFPSKTNKNGGDNDTIIIPENQIPSCSKIGSPRGDVESDDCASNVESHSFDTSQNEESSSSSSETCHNKFKMIFNTTDVKKYEMFSITVTGSIIMYKGVETNLRPFIIDLLMNGYEGKQLQYNDANLEYSINSIDGPMKQPNSYLVYTKDKSPDNVIHVKCQADPLTFDEFQKIYASIHSTLFS